MTRVNVTNVSVLNNPAKFLENIKFQVEFECIETLKEELDFRVIYVGAAETNDHDQILDSVSLTDVPVGQYRFLLETDPPNTTASYRQQEFLRIGYYVNNEYESEQLIENPPKQPKIEEIRRTIVTAQPRVTRFRINWQNPEEDLIADDVRSIERELADVEKSKLDEKDSICFACDGDGEGTNGRKRRRVSSNYKNGRRKFDGDDNDENDDEGKDGDLCNDDEDNDDDVDDDNEIDEENEDEDRLSDISLISTDSEKEMVESEEENEEDDNTPMSNNDKKTENEKCENEVEKPIHSDEQDILSTEMLFI
ncbi:hypothetical protein SNEBB_000817 [Seison nebaliae]|nr:hypothetical protein SNEBB_000817 [Seison nebaliae]